MRRGGHETPTPRMESDLSTVANGVLARSVEVSNERIREIPEQAG